MYTQLHAAMCVELSNSDPFHFVISIALLRSKTFYTDISLFQCPSRTSSLALVAARPKYYPRGGSKVSLPTFFTHDSWVTSWH